MIVVAVLCMVAFVGISGLDYLTRGDVSSTANLVREVYATYLAESIAAQIEARANAHPWTQRFWFLECQAKGVNLEDNQIAFFKGSDHVKILAEGLADSEYDYAGVLKDIKGSIRDYRIYVEVSVQGAQFSFSWDKRSSESLLTGLNRDATRLDKQHEALDPSQDPNDTLLENIKETSKVPSADTLTAEYNALLENLAKDTNLIQGGGPEVATTPSSVEPPAAPVYDPANSNLPLNANNSPANANNSPVNANNANNANTP